MKRTCFNFGGTSVLKYHEFYFHRIQDLKERVKELRAGLSDDEFIQHETVKLAARIRRADQEIIPQDPDRKEYPLRNELKKYRRYKQGLQRYRLFFALPIIPRFFSIFI